MFQLFYLENRKWKIKKVLKDAKSIFSSLKTDLNSVLFSEEKIDKRLLKKSEKSRYEKDSLLLKVKSARQ